MSTPFAPLDQYHPFVDDLGRITVEWYSWLTSLTDKLFITYSGQFDNNTAVDIVFADRGLANQLDTSYQVFVESSIEPAVSVINKTTTGFRLSSPAPITATVRWMLVRS